MYPFQPTGIYPGYSPTGIHPGYSSTGIYPGYSPTGLRPNPFAANPQVNLPARIGKARRVKHLKPPRPPKFLRPRKPRSRKARIKRRAFLGDYESDVIVQNVLDIARQIYPEGTAQFESYVNAKLQEYGQSYAKYQLQRQLEPFGQLWNTISTNPLLMFGLGVGVFYLLKR